MKEPKKPKDLKSHISEELMDYYRAQGMKGGKMGGKARAEKLTPERRSEIAKKAAEVRWGKKTASKKKQE